MNNYELIEKAAELNEKFNTALTGKHILIKLKVECDDFIIFRRNIDKKVAPASTAKIFLLDALLDFKIGTEDFILINESIITKGSGNNLEVGQRYKVNDLIKNLMISSSNTSATALRLYFEKISKTKYQDYVNEKNIEIGLKNTKIINEHGLANKEQYVTLKDLSVFLDKKINDNNFLDFCGLKEYHFFSESGKKVEIENTYNFYDDESTVAVKTGTLVPGVFNIILFFKINGIDGYIIDFYNESIKSRDADVVFILDLLRKWSEYLK